MDGYILLGEGEVKYVKLLCYKVLKVRSTVAERWWTSWIYDGNNDLE